jgi:SAM-dependent methyltransferase
MLIHQDQPFDREMIQALTSSELKNAASEFYWYHTIDLGKGVVIQGDYDMNDYLDSFCFPTSMHGMSVLDVGRASGFFAFLFEERGAEVTATELSSFFNWDFVGGDAERDRRMREIVNPIEFTKINITGAFYLAHAAKQSKVKPIETSIYEITSQTVGGPFDIVFAGSITSHLRDPIKALERLHNITSHNGVCIISVPYIGLDESLPLAAMVGTADEDRRSWWVVNKKCITEMLKAAGFSDIQIVGHFLLTLDRPSGEKGLFPHLTVHAKH